ncbi:hypothetical protein HUJ04_008400 [Dendroctonus ponderosae]|nr:hypothetical protein HUJ04_008400 [Dendroctonus ponderosae]
MSFASFLKVFLLFLLFVQISLSTNSGELSVAKPRWYYLRCVECYRPDAKGEACVKIPGCIKNRGTNAHWNSQNDLYF